MLDYILNILISYGINSDTSKILANIFLLILVIIISIILEFITTKVILKHIGSYVKNTKIKWDDIMLRKKSF